MANASAEVAACRQLQGRHRLRLELAAPHSDDALLKARLAREASHAAGPSMDNVQSLLRALGVPPRWRRPVAPEGVLFHVLTEQRNVSIPLPATGCSLYSDADGRHRAYQSLPVLVEATLSTLMLRRIMVPALPIALSTSQSTAAFVRSRPELRGLWDPIVELDETALQHTRRLTALPARAHPFLWKLAALLLTPFERTLFLDADLLVLSPTLVSNVLRNSLRIHEMAMPVDTNRPGNLDDERSSARSRCRRGSQQTSESTLCAYWNRAADPCSKQHALGHLALDAAEQDYALLPPMFGEGFPPVCTCVIAYRRTPRVHRLFAHAAARLAYRTNPSDVTNPFLSVRQTDQEMMWFEMFTGPPEEQPPTLTLPEEYYCPAVAGMQQAIDIAERLRRDVRPAWGYTSSKSKGQFVPKEYLHYLSGGQKDCHAVHVHYALSRLRGLENMTGDDSQGGTLHYALHLLDLEHFCWQRQAAGLPGCSISRDTKYVYPQGALPAGASDHPDSVRLFVRLLRKPGKKHEERLRWCGGDDDAPLVHTTLRLVRGEVRGARPQLAYTY